LYWLFYLNSDNIIAAYTNKVINIHPALLPKYGGRMYGMNVHRTLLENKKKTGITIHYVNEHYDEEGCFQKSVVLNGLETPEEVAIKIHMLEQEYFQR
jgi:phosphoribosylglycinamide formyltransferase-1